MPDKRITLLDSFRFFAILSVLLFHYYKHWLFVLYPSDLSSTFLQIGNIPFIKYGALGVQFFFIISGFVIYYSLCRNKSAVEFLKKRTFRILPTMMICSIITYICIELFDSLNISHFSTGVWSFIPSWLFIDPQFLNDGLNYEKFKLIDGAYWSLLVEVKFYLLAACVYYLSENNFLRNWLVVSLVVITVEIFLRKYTHGYLPNTEAIWRVLFFTDYIVYFTIGIFFYTLYSKIKPKFFEIIILGIIIAITYNRLYHIHLKVYLLVFILAFTTLVYAPSKLAFLEQKYISKIGRTSYSLYLLHQHIGIILIAWLLSLTNSAFLQALIPICIICLFIIISFLIDTYFEKPLKKWLKN